MSTFSTSLILYMNKTVNIKSFLQQFYLRIQMIQNKDRCKIQYIYTQPKKKQQTVERMFPHRQIVKPIFHQRPVG